MWRLDRAYGLLKEEVPHLRRLPSEYIREHFWLTTQPVEEPHDPADFALLLDDLGMDDHVMFSTDYPHWDFDAPDAAIPTSLAPERRRKIMSENARALYRFA
jgi:predicted TIM-barrel fold metal-dependent hydrolase